MRREIDNAVTECHPDALILDFGGVTFMDSSGIGLVMGRYRLVHAYGGSVRIQNPPPHIRKVMRIAGLETIATIESGGR
jgi:stage II sporulation protein AA (anti-sigma F factor antagonist)